MDQFDAVFSVLVGYLYPILFWEPIAGGPPFILLFLLFGGLFFTFYHRFINIRMLRHGIDVVRGKYDNPNEPGQITHFQALCSALSGTVGLGNIAGVAVAIGLGGPGAVLWLWITAFFGMTMKFASSVLAQMFRKQDKEGHVVGGPMVYLEEGIKQSYPKLAWLGKGLGILYAVFAVVGAIGAVCLFQVNQVHELLVAEIPALNEWAFLIGVFVAALTAIVLFGGIPRIGEVTARMVPSMCAFYLLSCLYIIFVNYEAVPAMFISIFEQAWRPDAAFGGFIGVLITGVRRAAFSNEAGLGSASIAHASAKTKEPVREGIVAMIGPIIDTHIVCTITALTLLSSGVYMDPAFKGKGIAMTAAAFAQIHPLMPLLLTIAALIFAYSTLITWGYYFQKCIEYLFGRAGVTPGRIVYILLLCIAPLLQLSSVIDFADMFLLSMAFPNILGMMLLAPKIQEVTVDYIRRYKRGEMAPFG